MIGLSTTTQRQATGSISVRYRAGVRKKWLLFGAFVLAIVLLAGFAVSRGAYAVSLRTLLDVLLGKADGPARTVLLSIRLPRVCAALSCGWALAISGLVIQSLLKNPLGSASTLGISQGAAFGAALSIVLFHAGMQTVTLAAFLGAIATTVIILFLARIKKLSAEAVILAGVALSALFSSATILVQYLATEIQLAIVVFWTFGDVGRPNWPQILIMAIAAAGSTLYFAFLRWALNAIASGEDTARGLGVGVERVRLFGMMAVALVAAFATAFHGVIAFVGLIAPHIARRLVGDDHGLLIAFSGVIGALLLLAADTFGRVVVGSASIPVGVITSFLGAPMFLYLLIRGYR